MWGIRSSSDGTITILIMFNWYWFNSIIRGSRKVTCVVYTSVMFRIA